MGAVEMECISARCAQWSRSKVRGIGEKGMAEHGIIS